MSQCSVHYELFLRRTAKSSFALETACEDKAQAIAGAEAALADGRAIAAQVTRETLDDATGLYRSVVVFSRGEATVAARAQSRGSQPAAKPSLCSSASDLYTVHARARISELLDGWLRHQGATAFELLHRPDLVERLDATGLELQHALQKIAIPEAHDRGVSVHQVIRDYHKLIDLAVTRLLRDKARGLFPTLSDCNVADCIRQARVAADPAYVLGVTVAVALAGCPDRRAKIDRLLDLAEAQLDDGGKSLLLQVVAPLLGEMLELRETLAELVGETLDLGDSVALMLRLVADDVVEALIGREPRFTKVFPPVPTPVRRLAAWLRTPGFAGVAAALARRAMAELKAGRRLHPHDPVAEIVTLRALARVLIHGPARVRPEDVQDAFVARSRHLVAADFVRAYVAAHGDGALAETQALSHLAENVAGGANRRAAGEWLRQAISSRRFEDEMLSGADTPSQKLMHLAALARGLGPAGLPDAERAELLARLGTLAGAIEAQSRLVQAIVRAPTGAPQRLLALLRLATGQTAPAGPASNRAREAAAKLVRDPAARAELAQAPEQMIRVRDLLQAAGLAA